MLLEPDDFEDDFESEEDEEDDEVEEDDEDESDDEPLSLFAVDFEPPLELLDDERLSFR